MSHKFKLRIANAASKNKYSSQGWLRLDYFILTLYFDSSLEFVVFVNYLLTQLTTYFEVIIINQ